MNSSELKALLTQRATETRESLNTVLANGPLLDRAVEVAELTASALAKGRTLYTCGNGGSAAQATHFSGELVGPFNDRERRPIAAVALGFDPSAATAVANDFSYDEVFSRQLEALGRSGDVLWALTTSGNSPNILATLETASHLDITSVLITGKGGGKGAALASHVLDVGLSSTPRIQELHLVLGHFLCEAVEALAKA